MLYLDNIMILNNSKASYKGFSLKSGDSNNSFEFSRYYKAANFFKKVVYFSPTLYFFFNSFWHFHRSLCKLLVSISNKYHKSVRSRRGWAFSLPNRLSKHVKSLNFLLDIFTLYLLISSLKVYLILKLSYLNYR